MTRAPTVEQRAFGGRHVWSRGMPIMRLAVFDIDGTLTDTNAVDDECFLWAIAKVLDLDAARLDWSAAPHITDAAIAGWLCERHCGRTAAPAELTRMTAIFVDRLQAELAASPARFAPVAGAIGVLQDLSAAGWTTALATGGWGASARLKLAAAGVSTDDVPLVCADDALTREDLLRLALARATEQTRGGFERVVSVGDGVWDVRAAAAVGWPFVGVARGAQADRLRAAGADVVLPDLVDRSALLRALERAGVPRVGR